MGHDSAVTSILIQYVDEAYIPSLDDVGAAMGSLKNCKISAAPMKGFWGPEVRVRVMVIRSEMGPMGLGLGSSYAMFEPTAANTSMFWKSGAPFTSTSNTQKPASVDLRSAKKRPT